MCACVSCRPDCDLPHQLGMCPSCSLGAGMSLALTHVQGPRPIGSVPPMCRCRGLCSSWLFRCRPAAGGPPAGTHAHSAGGGAAAPADSRPAPAKGFAGVVDGSGGSGRQGRRQRRLRASSSFHLRVSCVCASLQTNTKAQTHTHSHTSMECLPVPTCNGTI